MLSWSASTVARTWTTFSFLLPVSFLEYLVFLIIAGLITSQVFKSKWRNHIFIVVCLAILIEANGFYLFEQTGVDLYGLIFSEDFSPPANRKRYHFIRDALFCFIHISYYDFRFKTR